MFRKLGAILANPYTQAAIGGAIASAGVAILTHACSLLQQRLAELTSDISDRQMELAEARPAPAYPAAADVNPLQRGEQLRAAEELVDWSDVADEDQADAHDVTGERDPW